MVHDAKIELILVVLIFVTETALAFALHIETGSERFDQLGLNGVVDRVAHVAFGVEIELEQGSGVHHDVLHLIIQRAEVFLAHVEFIVV